MTTSRGYRKYRSVPINHMLKQSTVIEAMPLKKLNKELIEVYEKIKLNGDEVELRNTVMERYRKLIKSVIDCQVEPFGSTRTLLLVHNSDIDITVLINTSIKPGTKEYSTERQFSNTSLARIRAAVEEAGYCTGGVLHIRKAKTPILRFVDNLYGHNVDISINKVDGINTAEYVIKEMVARPFLRYFVVLLKYFLKRRNLSDAACGGLCSYAQFLMILDFVTLHPLIQNGNLDVEENIGVLFLDFFQYFGIDFPYERSVISVRDGKYKANREGSFYIEDPMLEGHNVASGCTNMKLIKDVFVYSYKVMTAALVSKIDVKRSVVDLWLRLNQGEMKQRQDICKVKRK